VLGYLAIGLIALHLVTHVPFVGPLVGLCSVILGLGMLAQAVRRWQRVSEQCRPVPPVAVAA
jgi:hypothetical protein